MNLKRLRRLSNFSGQPIATGSSCLVFKGIRTDQLGLKRDVAIKVIKDRSYFQELVSEWDQGTQISSRYLVSIIDVGEFQGKPALVMDYVNGYTLYELFARGLLNQFEKLFLYQKIEVALLELHELGRIHGDLSPKNIMIDHNVEIKLIDFGLSKIGKGNSRCTREFASEELLKKGTRTEKGDLESLLKLKAWMLAGVDKNQTETLLQLDSKTKVNIANKIKLTKSSEKETASLHGALQKNEGNRSIAVQLLAILFFLVLPWPAAQSKKIERFDLGKIEIRTQKWVSIS